MLYAMPSSSIADRWPPRSRHLAHTMRTQDSEEVRSRWHRGKDRVMDVVLPSCQASLVGHYRGHAPQGLADIAEHAWVTAGQLGRPEALTECYTPRRHDLDTRHLRLRRQHCHPQPCTLAPMVKLGARHHAPRRPRTPEEHARGHDPQGLSDVAERAQAVTKQLCRAGALLGCCMPRRTAPQQTGGRHDLGTRRTRLCPQGRQEVRLRWLRGEGTVTTHKRHAPFLPSTSRRSLSRPRATGLTDVAEHVQVVAVPLGRPGARTERCTPRRAAPQRKESPTISIPSS